MNSVTTDGLEKMPSKQLANLYEEMSDHIYAILRCFKTGAKITIVVRNPGYDVVLGNDDLNASIEAIVKVKDSTPTCTLNSQR